MNLYRVKHGPGASNCVCNKMSAGNKNKECDIVNELVTVQIYTEYNLLHNAHLSLHKQIRTNKRASNRLLQRCDKDTNQQRYEVCLLSEELQELFRKTPNLPLTL